MAWPYQTIACLLASAVGMAAGSRTLIAEGAYSGAFGAEAPDNTESGEALPADAKQGAKAALSELGQLGSFPLKVHNNNKPHAGAKTALAGPAIVPTAAEKKLKVGGCAFAMKTGSLSARQYVQDAKGNYLVQQDALGRDTILPASPEQPAYISVTSEVFAEMAADAKDACRALVGAQKKRLGKVDLEGSDVTLVTADNQKSPVAIAHPAVGATLYLAWDAVANTVRLFDQAGLAPSVESPIFSVKPESAGEFAVAVTPKLSLKKISHKGAD